MGAYLQIKLEGEGGGVAGRKGGGQLLGQNVSAHSVKLYGDAVIHLVEAVGNVTGIFAVRTGEGSPELNGNGLFLSVAAGSLCAGSAAGGVAAAGGGIGVAGAESSYR